MSAAVSARALGLSVLLLEKNAQVGGATAFSGGAIWVPGNALMSEADQPENSRRYLKAILGNNYDDAKVETYLKKAPEMLAFFAAHSLVRFSPLNSPDYYPEREGAWKGRTIMATTFDGSVIPRHLALMRRPLPPLTLGGMQFEMQELATMQAAFKSPTAFARSASLFGRYLVGRLRFGRDPRLVRGNALVGRLLASAVGGGAEIWTNAKITRISQEPTDQSFQVVVEREGRPVTVLARNLLLATGGFAASPVMSSRFISPSKQHLTMQPDTNVGDGIAFGENLGGRMETANIAPAIWSPISEAVIKGRPVRFPHLMMDRLKPGSIMVGPDGRRFVNEGRSYQDVVDAMRGRSLGVAYLIADKAFVKQFGLGLVRPAPFSFNWALRSGYLTRASTVNGLAERLGMPPATLSATVEAFNGFARTGVDGDFHRGADAYSRHHGDPTHQPNPGLGEIKSGPFFAIKLYPGDLGSVQGLKTDALARVLDENDVAIAGLYACGADMNSVMRGAYPGGGVSIGSAMTFAYVATRHIAENLEVPSRKAT